MAKRRPSGDGMVRKKEDGSWEGRVVIGYDEKNLPKTKNVLAKTKSECVEKLKQLQEQYAPPKSDKIMLEMPFGEWMDFWYQNYSTLTFGTDLIIDPLHRQVLSKGSLLKLTRKEFNMLHFLASHPGQVFTREQLYTRIWRCDSDFNVDEAVRSHIKFLRRKLASSGKEYIQTVWGIGYRFAP